MIDEAIAVLVARGWVTSWSKGGQAGAYLANPRCWGAGAIEKPTANEAKPSAPGLQDRVLAYLRGFEGSCKVPDSGIAQALGDGVTTAQVAKAIERLVSRGAIKTHKRDDVVSPGERRTTIEVIVAAA